MHVFLSFLPFEFLFGIKLLLRINDTYFRFFKQRRGQTVQPKKMERCGHVVMGRRMRHLRHLPSSGTSDTDCLNFLSLYIGKYMYLICR